MSEEENNNKCSFHSCQLEKEMEDYCTFHHNSLNKKKFLTTVKMASIKTDGEKRKKQQKKVEKEDEETLLIKDNTTIPQCLPLRINSKELKQKIISNIPIIHDQYVYSAGIVIAKMNQETKCELEDLTISDYKYLLNNRIPICLEQLTNLQFLYPKENIVLVT